MKRLPILCLLIVIVGIFSTNCNKKKSVGSSSGSHADVIYHNGKIYTVNKAQPWADGVAIKDGKFLKVGFASEMKEVTGDNTKMIDLKGRFVMPGLHDLHLHLEGFYNAKMMEGKTLRYTGEEKSIAELQAKLKNYADKNPDLKVLFAEQLPQALFPNLSPTRAFIDEVVPDRPVVMLSDSEHEAMLNTKALQMEGITRDTPTPFGGEIIKDDQGEPTGWLKEKAAGMWGWSHLPALSREQHKEGMLTVLEYLNSLGITTVKHQHTKNHWAQGIKDVDTEGDLNMRIGLSWTFRGPLEPSSLEEQDEAIQKRQQFASDLINPNFVKLSVDGNTGTTGLVVDPYLETKDHGIAFYQLEQLIEDVARFDAMGLGITAHSNADGAVRQFLDALEETKRRNGELKGRHQVAHAILVHPDDLPRFSQLDATAEFSPIFWIPSPISAALSGQLGPERMAHLFPMKSLQENGGRFVIASDGPLFWQEPMVAIEVAVTRQKPGGSKEKLAPVEAIDLETVIRAYTINGAFLMGHEESVGSIEQGKVADMIILDKNLFEIPVTEIGKTKVLQTIFNGSLIYDAVE